MTKQFIRVLALSAMVMLSTATVVKAQSLSHKENPRLTPTQNLHCEFSQFSYPAKPLGKQMKISTRCVEGQSTDNIARQSKVCSIYFDQYQAATNNKFQVSRSSCFAPKSLKDSAVQRR